MQIKLLDLPYEVLSQIFHCSDAPSLLALSETCQFFWNAVNQQNIWEFQAKDRFRVTRRTVQSRQIRESGGVTWRAFYAHWHRHGRMPFSRVSGTSHVSFASAVGPGCRVWIMVNSTDDCRLLRKCIRLRVVLQNFASGPKLNYNVGFAGTRILFKNGDHIPVEYIIAAFPNFDSFVLKEGAVVIRGDAQVGNHPKFRQEKLSASAIVTDIRVDRAESSSALSGINVLEKNDFVVLSIKLKIPSFKYEVEALDALESLSIDVKRPGGKLIQLQAFFQDKVLWNSYERIPGGWWVRRDPNQPSPH